MFNGCTFSEPSLMRCPLSEQTIICRQLGNPGRVNQAEAERYCIAALNNVNVESVEEKRSGSAALRSAGGVAEPRSEA